MKILVKEIDRLKSELHNRYVSEYLIYITIDKVNIECHDEFGDVSKIRKVNELFNKYFKHSGLTLPEVFEEITMK